MKLYFKINERLKKIFNYFSIFTIVLGTTFGSINSANAADFNVLAGVTITKADNNGAAEGTTAVGSTDDATMKGATAIFDTTADSFEIAILTGDNSVAHVATITDTAGASGNTFTITTLTNVVKGITLTVDGNLDIKGETDGGAINVADGILVDLLTDDDLDIDSTIDGQSSGAGLLTVTGNLHDLNADIGQTNALALITVAGDDADFNEEVSTTTLTITGAGTTLAKNVGADTINLDAGLTTINGLITDAAGTGSASVVLADATNVLDIGKAGTHKFNTTVTDSEGEINTTIDGVVIDGTIGTSLALIQDIDIDGSTTINGNIFADAVDVATTETLTLKANNGSTLTTLTGSGAITFSGTSAQSTDQIDGSAAYLGTITAGNAAGVTFSTVIGGTNGVDALVVDGVDLPEVIISENDNQVGEIDMDADAIMRIAKTVTDGETVFLASTDMKAADIPSTAKIYMPVNLSDGQTLKLFDTVDDNNTFTTNLNSALQDTGIMTYTATAATDDYTVTANLKSDTTAASDLSVTTNNAKALKQAFSAAIVDGANADSTLEDAFKNALNQDGGYSATEDTALAKQVAPQDDMISGSTFATKAMTGSLQGIMSNRMAALRSGEAYYGSGMSAGANMSANSGFLQVFGTDAEQKNKTVGSGTQFGYDATSSGVALGFDGITDNGSVVGLSLSMSETDVDGKGTGKSKNDIDSYTASIYMDKSTDAGYVEGSLTVGLNENNSSRIVNTAGLNRTYKGDYDSEQVSLKIGGGKPNAVGMSGYVTPFGSITATKISTNAYTETSTTANDNLRLRVAQDDVDSVVGTVGLKYHNVLDNGGSPMISLAINNEFGDSTINSTNTYQGGGSSFTTSTDVEELSATLGLGYSFSSDNASIEFAYEADANDDDYLSHYGSIKLVSKF